VPIVSPLALDRGQRGGPRYRIHPLQPSAQLHRAGGCSLKGELTYSGGGKHRDAILVTVGSTTLDKATLNMDGQVPNTGNGNNRDRKEAVICRIRPV
jgi:hypothetical protein